jgi:hypothetical protein
MKTIKKAKIAKTLDKCILCNIINAKAMTGESKDFNFG